MTQEEHIKYWVESAEHDFETAESLFNTKKNDWCLFIGHLVIEKTLKAIYVKNNESKTPPKIHNLVKLSKFAKLTLDEDQIIFLDEINDFNLAVRYPKYKNEFYKLSTDDFTKIYFTKIKEFFQWLKSQLQ